MKPRAKKVASERKEESKMRKHVAELRRLLGLLNTPEVREWFVINALSFEVEAKTRALQDLAKNQQTFVGLRRLMDEKPEQYGKLVDDLNALGAEGEKDMAKATLHNADGSTEVLELVKPPLGYKRVADVKAEIAKEAQAKADEDAAKAKEAQKADDLVVEPELELESEDEGEELDDEELDDDEEIEVMTRVNKL